MKLNTRIMALLLLIILFGGISLAKLSGLWVTESEKQPSLIKEGEFAGMSDPGDIRGSYTFGDISTSFDITPEILADAFGIETDSPEDFQCKMLEEYYPNMSEEIELGIGAVKQFVALYTGLPYEGEDGIPSTGVEILKGEGKWTDHMETNLEIIDIASLAVFEGEISIEKEDEEEHSDEIAVKGKTTVADLLEWGISIGDVEDILGTEIENENMTVRDVCTQNGLSFSSIKEKFNGMLQDN